MVRAELVEVRHLEAGSVFFFDEECGRCVSRGRRGGDFDEGKFDEWVRLSRGFTDGSISGKAQREAYGNAVWANNDKTDAKNRIGLCIRRDRRDQGAGSCATWF